MTEEGSAENPGGVAIARRLAVVTGGTRGIGRGIAERMVQEGYRCLVTGSTRRALSPVDGADFLAVDFGVREETQAFAEHLQKLGPDILVNNAGINLKGSTEGFSENDAQKMYLFNLETPFRLCKAVVPVMQRKQWGRIVNITSIWSVVGNPGNAVYCSTKFGLDGFTTALAAEVAASNVLVNAVAPGYIRTDATDEAFSDEERQEWIARIPIRRLGTPKEIGALVAWLVSDENSYLTGQNIVIDGGLVRV